MHREVPLGLAHPAGGIVADGVRAQAVGNLKLQGLLTPAQDSLLCSKEAE